jgi:preprotein translocase subunit SecD
MKPALITATVTAAIIGLGTMVARAEDIALSLVNPKGRIDIPVGAVKEVSSEAVYRIRNPTTGEVHEYRHPHVDVCLAAEFKERICQLTRQIVEEPLAIVVDCETISEPIVREPICSQSCFRISIFDLADAVALAQRIRRGTSKPCAPSS